MSSRPVASVCVALSDDAWSKWRFLFDSGFPEVRFAPIVDPSTAMAGADRIGLDDLPVEIVWMSADSFLGPLRNAFDRLVRTSPTLRWIHSVGAGYDMPILQAALARGLRLTISHVNSITIAEYVLRTVLDRMQRIDDWREARRQKTFPRGDMREVWGTTWMIVGCGSIGCAVAERARAFGARTIGVRRNPTGGEPVDEMIRPDAVAANLGRADVVVIAAPASVETHRLVDAGFLARMKADAIFVNIARASLVDEAALIAALEAGKLDWAVLDVHSVEVEGQAGRPADPASPLWTHPEIDLTPHIAAIGLGRHERGARLFRDNLRRYLDGGSLPDEVTRKP